jgi:CHAD domain-containing protein
MMNTPLAAQTGAAALGLLYESALAAADAAIERNDAESLHDLRVALRRLTVLVEQFAASGYKRKSLLRDIKSALKQSNRGRDAQVMLTWLEGEWPCLDERERIGARQWQRTLERMRKHRLFEPKQASPALKRMVRTLDKLSPQDDRVQLPLGLLAARCLEQQANELGALMTGDGVSDQLHFIRLKAKTVRYLLLPFCDESLGCARALQELQRLQTQLGEWHDAVVRQQSLLRLLRKKVVTLLCDTEAKGVVRRVAVRSPALPGLMALARSNALAQQRLVGLIERKYLRDGGTGLTNPLHQAIAELRKAATARG